MQSAQGVLSLLRSFWSMGRLLKISGRPSVVCSSTWSFSKCWACFNYPPDAGSIQCSVSEGLSWHWILLGQQES